MGLAVGAGCSSESERSDPTLDRTTGPGRPEAINPTQGDSDATSGDGFDLEAPEAESVGADVDRSVDASTDAPVRQPLAPALADTNTPLEPGSPLWALVLAGASEPRDPLLDGAVAEAARLGYMATSTNCDEGAPEALGMAPGGYTVSIYFADRAAAELLQATEATDAVIAEVNLRCPD